MARFWLSLVAYVIATFATQAISHFAINKGHYATVTYLRDAPIFPLGVLAMLVEGGIAAYSFPFFAGNRSTVGKAVVFAWLCGGFLVSYIAFGEAAKYKVPSVGSWVGVEVLAGFVQFTAFGLMLAMIHRPPASPN